MNRWVPSPEAYDLFHRGQIALSEVEAQGVRVDREYLDRALDETAVRIRELDVLIKADPLFSKWKRLYGDRTKTTSPEQLAGLVFGELKHVSRIKTTSGKRASASEKALEGIDLPIVRNYLDMQHTIKDRDTFLIGIKRELVQHGDGDWYVHPNFNLNTVPTFRSSADSPTFHNQPTRNPRAAETVRRCYVPRRGHQILEIDYGQIEVRVPCAYCFDPSLIKYCTDPATDMHRDVCAQLFFLTEKQAKQKSLRHIAKNQFVFPTIYGSYYCQMVPAIWDSIGSLQVEDLKVSVRDHLAKHGVTDRGLCESSERPEKGTFEYHVKQIEDHFWKERFPTFAQWKRDWFAAYRREGGCRFLTGFTMTGPHAKNDITNWCIQGSAFHLTLWSLIRIVNRLRRYNMRTRVIGEIHDSIQFDVWPPERDAVVDMAVAVMTEEIKTYAPWLNIPLVVEPEICPIDRSWFDKRVMVNKAGKWVPADMEKWEKSFGPWSLQC